MSSEIERRRGPRVGVAVQVERRHGLTEQALGVSRDLSATGIYVEVTKVLDGEDPLSDGDSLWLRFRLPELPQAFSTRARIVRMDRDARGELRGLALEFDEITADLRAELERFVDASFVTREHAKVERAQLGDTTPVWSGETTSRTLHRQASAPLPSGASLVTLAGSQIGQRYFVSAEGLVLGRASHANVVLDDAEASRLHARVFADEAGTMWLQDTGSRNGTLVDERRVDKVALRDGCLVRIGRTILKYLAPGSVEAGYYDNLYRLSRLDTLTEALNRVALLETLGREMARSSRHDTPLSLLIFDIDGFKGINDKLGHLAGDMVLQELARLVRREVRQEDILARYGGDEFVLVLPAIGPEGALRVAEKLRACVAAHEMGYEETRFKVTLSIGVRSLDATELVVPMEPETLIESSDGKLYEAKRRGKNCVVA